MDSIVKAYSCTKILPGNGDGLISAGSPVKHHSTHQQSGRTKMPSPLKTDDPVKHYTGLAVARGTCFGTVFGAAFGEVGTGLGLGLAVELAVGAGIGASVKRKQNKTDRTNEP